MVILARKRLKMVIPYLFNHKYNYTHTQIYTVLRLGSSIVNKVFLMKQFPVVNPTR